MVSIFATCIFCLFYTCIICIIYNRLKKKQKHYATEIFYNQTSVSTLFNTVKYVPQIDICFMCTYGYTGLKL